jgi:hypothetical protein
MDGERVNAAPAPAQVHALKSNPYLLLAVICSSPLP